MILTRHLLIPLFLVSTCSVPVFSQQSPLSTPDPDFEYFTKIRLQAAAAEIRRNWDKSVATIVVVIDQSGMRQDRDHFWQEELRSCNEARCTAEDFRIKLQLGIAVVEYSLIVASADGEKLIRSTDTYMLSDSSWKIISGFRTFVPNARKPRANVDITTLQSYVGKYSDKSARIYEFFLNNDRLFARRSGQSTSTELIPESPTKFYVIGDESSTEFIKSKRGEVTGIVIRTTTGEQTLTRVK